jgi:nucleoside-diphosphate-sugar epimerase
MILITGSNGFIGSSLVPYLINSGINTMPITRDSLKNFNIKTNIEILHTHSLKGIIHLAGVAHDLKNDVAANEYYQVNTELTKKVYSEFILSSATIFIYMSSVKACSDKVIDILTEEATPNPITHYGKSKLLAEEFILKMNIPLGKRVYILRPCMIHGPNNTGNFSLLYKYVRIGLPWILGKYKNERSFCSIDNLNFIIKELINNDNIPSGIYNIADDEPLSTTLLIELIAKSLNKKITFWNIPKCIIEFFAKLGDLINLPFNSNRLNKLTDSYIVSNKKIINSIKKNLPFSSKAGILKTIYSFK